MLGAQRRHALYAAVRGATGGKRLVAELGDAPLAAEAVEHRSEVEDTLEQGEVSVRSLEHLACGAEAQRRQLAGVQGGSRVERDLHRQDWAALGVGLHGATRLRQLPGEGRFQGGPVEAQQAPRRRHCAEAAGRGGAEEAKAGLRSEAEAGRDIDPHGDRRDQLGAADAAAVRRRPARPVGRLPWHAPRRPRAGSRIPGCAFARH
jgi:hypothetical protein